MKCKYRITMMVEVEDTDDYYLGPISTVEELAGCVREGLELVGIVDVSDVQVSRIVRNEEELVRDSDDPDAEPCKI